MTNLFFKRVQRIVGIIDAGVGGLLGGVGALGGGMLFIYSAAAYQSPGSTHVNVYIPLIGAGISAVAIICFAGTVLFLIHEKRRGYMLGIGGIGLLLVVFTLLMYSLNYQLLNQNTMILIYVITSAYLSLHVLLLFL